MAQLVRQPSLFAKDLISVPNTHGRWLPTTCNSSSIESSILSWLPWASVAMYIHAHSHVHTHTLGERVVDKTKYGNSSLKFQNLGACNLERLQWVWSQPWLHNKFQAILDYKMKPHFQNKQINEITPNKYDKAIMIWLLSSFIFNC